VDARLSSRVDDEGRWPLLFLLAAILLAGSLLPAAEDNNRLLSSCLVGRFVRGRPASRVLQVGAAAAIVSSRRSKAVFLERQARIGCFIRIIIVS